jgi:hypothetical protein
VVGATTLASPTGTGVNKFDAELGVLEGDFLGVELAGASLKLQAVGGNAEYASVHGGSVVTVEGWAPGTVGLFNATVSCPSPTGTEVTVAPSPVVEGSTVKVRCR